MDSPDPEQLCLRHSAALFPFLVNLVRNESDARDLLQELFLSLARQPALLRGIRKEREFLFRMAHNLAVDCIRRRESRTRVHEAAGQEVLEIFQPEENPDEDAYRRELTRALGELPPDQRAVVHLKLWEGLTFDSIAEALDIPLNTAASRYRYGIDKLRELLRPIYEELR
jgi:RNA polymerase sigma-70 factor (ECF subfamily)